MRAFRIPLATKLSALRKSRGLSVGFGVGAATAAIGTWGFFYYYLTDMIERSSPLVRQTIFNLQQAEESSYPWGKDIRALGKPTGHQSQREGRADIEFKVGSDATGFEGTARVVAMKCGWDWKTELLQVHPKGSDPIIVIKS